MIGDELIRTDASDPTELQGKFLARFSAMPSVEDDSVAAVSDHFMTSINVRIP